MATNHGSGQQGTPELVELDSLRGGLSPRLGGASVAHTRQLAEVVDELPPIVVQRSSMRVVDGMHRLEAARLRGSRAIPVIYFDGSDAEAFVAAVRLNLRHGMPLTTHDRSAAAKRILASHPQWSDRWIASLCGAATKTVAGLRRCSADDRFQLNTRLGRDGRRHPDPASAAEGRQRAAEIMRRRPEASLREVARESGVSLGTAHDVRRRLAEQTAGPAGRAPSHAGRSPAAAATPALTIRDGLARLAGDPSLRHTDRGRAMLRLVSATLGFISQSEEMAGHLPAHCRELIGDIAQACARGWQMFGDRVHDVTLSEDGT